MEIVGAIIMARSSQRVLLGKRSPQCEDPNVWSIIAGHVEAGESPKEALYREVVEETGTDVRLFHNANVKFLNQYVVPTGDSFNLYLISVPVEFMPRKNNEHTKMGWFRHNKLPTPYHRMMPQTYPFMDAFAKKYYNPGDIPVPF